MIAIDTLKYLVAQKIKDAQCLLTGGRNSSAIYLMGYAIEIALKQRICLSLGFDGFPESASELNEYIKAINNVRVPLPANIRQIKNHDLQLLLQFSGLETKILTEYPLKWFTLIEWNPASRYRKEKVYKKKVLEFINHSKKIIKELL